MEQPASSLLHYYKPFEAEIGLSYIHSVLTGLAEAPPLPDSQLQPRSDGRIYTEPLAVCIYVVFRLRKPTVLITNAPWLFPLATVKLTSERRHGRTNCVKVETCRHELNLLRSSKKIRMVTKYKDKRGETRVVDFSDVKIWIIPDTALTRP